MTLLTCTRRLQFCAGHRVMDHEGKCANMHGHEWEVRVTVHAPALDTIGRVIDFGVIKQKLGGWIDEKWDHGFLYWFNDTPVQDAFIAFNKAGTKVQKAFGLPCNPTSENLAQYLITIVCPALFKNDQITVIAVDVQETPNCYATATLSSE